MNPYITATAIDVSKACIGLIDAVYRKTSHSEIIKTLVLNGARNPVVTSIPAIGAVPSSIWITDKPWFASVAFQGIERTNFEPYLKNLGPQSTVDDAGGFHTGILSALRSKNFVPVIRDFLTSDLQLATGHSLGGACSLSLAALYSPVAPGGQRGVVTFGSPRPFSGIGPTLEHCTSVIRWMRPFDSITRFPPRGAESIPTSVVLAQIIGAWPAEWWQPEGGRVYDGEGGYQSASTTGSLLTVSEADLLVWASGGRSSLSVAHDFLGYAQSTLNLAQDGLGFWARPLDKGGMESPSFVNPPIELQRAASAAGFPLPMTMGCQHGPAATQARHVSQSF